MGCNAWLVVLVCLFVSSQGLIRHPDALKESLPGYAITASIEQLNMSSGCRAEMKEYRDAVDHGILWALRMLDTSGEPSSGFILGNNYWTGHRQQCQFLSSKINLPLSEKRLRNNSVYRNPAEENPPFELTFFSAHIRHNSTLQYHIAVAVEDVVVLGLCLPASCSKDEVAVMLKKVFDDRLLLVEQLYSTHFELIKVSDLKDDHMWLLSGKIITILFILAALFGTVIAGTMYDVLIHQKRSQKRDNFLTYENNNTSELKGEMEEKQDRVHEFDVPAEITSGDSQLGQFLLCFSAYSNAKMIFKVDNSSEDISSFHGLKFFGMIWITMVHTIYFTLNIIGNKAEGFTMAKSIENQILTNASLSVDTYFFLGGFLLTYGCLKAQTKEKKVVTSFSRNAANFVSGFIKRYLRLTPAYLVTILLVILNFSWHENFSIFYFNEPVHERCSKYWWRNLLYINNFFEWEELCLSWSWYVANDMQFFVFGLFVMMLSAVYPYTALMIEIATFLVSTVLHAYVAYSTRYIPTLDEQYETMSYMYIRPWMRIPPYLVGMGTAYVLAKWNYKLHLPKKTLAIGWTLSVLCNCTILFGVANRKMPLGLAVFYETFSRTAWSFGIAWLAIVCTTKNGGIVEQFLSLRAWIPLSRVTYCAYLLNPFLILSVAMFSNFPFHVDFLTTGCICLGICMITYVCAIGLSIIAEVPAIVFLRAISNSNRRMK